MTIKTWWGADVKTALTFYHAYIRSIIDYGSILYGSASNSALKKLDVTQNKALRICLGAMKSTPTEPLHVEAYEPPLVYRRQYLSEKFLLKISLNNPQLLHDISRLNVHDLINKFWNNKNSPPLSVAFRDYASLLSSIENPFTSLTSLDFYSLCNNIPVTIPTYNENENICAVILKTILSNWNDSELIYTDASKSSSGTGCAYYIPSKQETLKIRLNNNHSIFTAEAIAIHEALLYVRSLNIHTSIILSDSLSVLTALKNSSIINITTNPLLIKIKQIVYDIKSAGNEVYFVWVKAHIGLKYNEYVDALAKDSIHTGTFKDYKLSITDVFSSAKSNRLKKWKCSWNEVCFTNPSRYMLIHPDIPSRPWYESYNIPRKYTATITRMKFGHACFPSHLHRIRVLQSASCDHCNKYGDLDHIFFECSKNNMPTENFYKTLLDNKIPTPYNILSLLALERKEVYDAMIVFLKDSRVSL